MPATPAPAAPVEVTTLVRLDPEQVEEDEFLLGHLGAIETASTWER